MQPPIPASNLARCHWPIWTGNRRRLWDSAAAKFTDNQPPGGKLTRPQHDKTTGPYVVAVLTGFITIGPGRPANKSRHDRRYNVYDRRRHLYAIYGKPGPLHLARRWHSRQAAWRCGRKVDGRPIRIPPPPPRVPMLTTEASL